MRLLPGILQCSFGPRCVRQSFCCDGLIAWLNYLPNLVNDLQREDVRCYEHLIREQTLSDQSQQQVFGADVVEPEALGFVVGQADDSLSLIGKLRVFHQRAAVAQGLTIRLSCRGRLGGRGPRRTGMAAPVSFSRRWFGSFFLWYQPTPKGDRALILGTEPLLLLGLGGQGVESLDQCRRVGCQVTPNAVEVRNHSQQFHHVGGVPPSR